VPASDPVATFAGPAGERLTLVRQPPPAEGNGVRAASLEEVVMGYLSSGRVAVTESAA
jgi:hypothetical protein